MTKSPNPKILIRTPNWLGDLVISTGFISAVLENFPNSEIDLIVRSGFENLPLIHRGKILIFDPKKNSSGDFGKKLIKNNYDIFFVLPPSFSSAWMAFKSKASKRIGYKGQFRSILLNYSKSYEKKPRTEHILKEYMNLLSPNLSIEKYPPYLKTSRKWIESNLNSLEYPLPQSFFAISPGAVYGRTKQWPTIYFRKLVKKLNKFTESQTIILGTFDDIKLGEEISNGLESVQNFCGKTSLSQLIAVLSKAKLLIGNDSGSMHLMSALKRPQIAIFGSTSPKWTSPINPNSTIIKEDLKCSPCFSRTCRYNHYECLTKITPEIVFQKIQKIITKLN
tara:strand:+ start:235 stop:1242 length:1008 start_codon:yes stop_codon:yes gene_type:complete